MFQFGMALTSVEAKTYICILPTRISSAHSIFNNFLESTVEEGKSKIRPEPSQKYLKDRNEKTSETRVR